MTITYRAVPDVLREREPLVKGRPPQSELSKMLLRGTTVFISGPKKTWGSLYKLAQNHGMNAKTKRIMLNNEEGTLVWFIEAR